MASEESRALFQRLVDGIAASARRQLTTERRGEKLRGLAMVALGFLALWWAIRYVAGPNSTVRKAMETPRTQAAAGSGPLSPGVESPETFGQIPSATMLRTRASIDEGTAKAAKARQRQFLYTVEDVVQVIADAEATQKAFEATVQKLLTDEAGKKIAATQRGVPLFARIVETERVPAGRLAELSQLLETIAGPVRKAHGEDANWAVPGAEQERMLGEIHSEAKRAHAQYRDAAEDLAILIRQAHTRTPASGVSYPAPIDKPLGKAVEDYRAGLRASALDEQERRLAEQRKSNDERLTQELVKLELAKGQAKEDGVRQEATALLKQQQEATKAREAEALRRRLVAKAREPRVLQMLDPFLTRGYMQPKEWQGTFLAFERTREREDRCRSRRCVPSVPSTPARTASGRSRGWPRT